MEFRPNARSDGVSDQHDSKFYLAPIVKTSFYRELDLSV